MEPECSYTVEDSLIRGVLVRAVQSEKPRPGLWMGMIFALSRAVVLSGAEDAGAFLFQVMTDRLLEEYHSIKPNNDPPE